MKIEIQTVGHAVRILSGDVYLHVVQDEVGRLVLWAEVKDQEPLMLGTIRRSETDNTLQHFPEETGI